MGTTLAFSQSSGNLLALREVFIMLVNCLLRAIRLSLITWALILFIPDDLFVLICSDNLRTLVWVTWSRLNGGNSGSSVIVEFSLHSIDWVLDISPVALIQKTPRNEFC